MYTVFQNGSPKVGILGPVFVRTLRAARAEMVPGDEVQGWSNSGGPKGRWVLGYDGRMRKLPNPARRSVRYARNRAERSS